MPIPLMRNLLTLSCLITLVTALAGLFFINDLAWMHTILIISLVVTALTAARRGARGTAISAGLTALIGLTWALSQWYPLYIGLSLLAVAVAAVGLSSALRRSRPSTRGRRTLHRVVVVVVAVPLTAVTVVLGVTAITPVPLITFLQSTAFPASNRGQVADPGAEQEVGNGDVRISDIRYGSTYPNSFLDVYLADGDRTGTAPTMVYVHGGGYTWGDKASNDPTTNTTSSAVDVYSPFLDAGYNVVSLNYALAPEYNYPVPILQMSEAMAFLADQGAQYGLSTDQLVLIGGSAGGQLVGQFAAIQTNPDYSASTGIAPVVPAGNLRAVLFNSALLDLEQFSNTGTAYIDYIFLQCGRSYFSDGFLGNAEVKEANVIDAISADFPPSYISDGNYATFDAQAHRLDNRMEELGISHEFTYFPRSEAKLFHGFETGTTPQAAENLQRELRFLSTHVPVQGS